VGEVQFSEWTRDGTLRQPSFKGLREDKDHGRSSGKNLPNDARMDSCLGPSGGAPSASGW
jgi:ATP-dependent DNA ligase